MSAKRLLVFVMLPGGLIARFANPKAESSILCLESDGEQEKGRVQMARKIEITAMDFGRPTEASSGDIAGTNLG